MFTNPQRFVRRDTARRTFFGCPSGIHWNVVRAFAFTLVFEHPREKFAMQRMLGCVNSNRTASFQRRSGLQQLQVRTLSRSSSTTCARSPGASVSNRRDILRLVAVASRSCSSHVLSARASVARVPTARVRPRDPAIRQQFHRYRERI